MKDIDIAVIRGDGIGPEIIEEGLKVVKTAAKVAGRTIKFTEYPFGSNFYFKNGVAMPDNATEELKQHDAIYFGAVGDPNVPPGVLEGQLILKMRYDLDQYINLRPVKLYPGVPTRVKDLEPLEFFMVRENLEDFYIGVGQHLDPGNTDYKVNLKLHRALYDMLFDMDVKVTSEDEYAFNMGVISRKNTERVMKYAFELAEKKGKKLVTAVDKCNVLPQMYNLWRDVFQKEAAKHPGLETEMSFADAVNMWILKEPEKFGVVILPNLMGDILSDLGAMVAGGLGFAAGGNINPEGVSMFEPIHGSAPKYAGKNVINPVATIGSAVLMFEQLGEDQLAGMIEKGIWETMAEGKVKTRDMGGTATCSDVGDAISAKVIELFDK